MIEETDFDLTALGLADKSLASITFTASTNGSASSSLPESLRLVAGQCRHSSLWPVTAASVWRPMGFICRLAATAGRGRSCCGLRQI